MEFLVTMTTEVPDGTSEQEVADVRAREAAHTAELARQGRVRRLWRPPLAPGEWRTLGLFVADDADDLEGTLAGMPLRVWRTDEVTPLAAHSNDPGADRVALAPAATEYLTTLTVSIPSGTSAVTVADLTTREGQRTAELAESGQLVRLWRLPPENHNLGHWQADSADQLRDAVASLPMAGWLTVDTLPLTRHPSDPAAHR